MLLKTVCSVLLKLRESKDLAMNFLFFSMILQTTFHFSFSRLYIYHHNYTFNPLVNNVSMEIETFKTGSLNFSYSLNVWNHVEINSEIRKEFID